MSVRQYIGARYVTKIYENTLDPSSAEWQAGVNYEPLTLVTYNYGSYLSKKNVPASVGDPSSNPTYWTQTGFYNGQISNLQDQIDDINNKLSAKKKYIFIGDSYGLMNDGWLSYLVSDMNLTADDYYNGVVSGSAFTLDGSLKWENNLVDLINNMSDDEKASITDIVCIGGINDCVPYATMGEASDAAAYNKTVNRIIDFCNTAAAYCPNAMVSTFFVGNTIEDEDPLGQRYYSNIVRTVSAWNQARAVNLRNFTGSEYILHVYSLMSNDGVHPNTNGCKEIAYYVANALNGGNNFYLIGGPFEGPINLAAPSAPTPVIWSTINGNLTYLLEHGRVNISHDNNITVSVNPHTFEDGDTVDIGTLTPNSVLYGKHVILPCKASLINTATTDGIELHDACIELDKGHIIVHLNKVTYNYTGTGSYTASFLIVSIGQVSYSMLQN